MSVQFFSEPFVVLDTETSGVYNSSQLLEIAAVCVDEWGRIRSRFSSLVRPQKTLSANCEALAVNKIRLEDLNSAPQWDTVRVYFDAWLRAIPTKSAEVISTAFNAPFDKRILDRHGFSLNWGTCVRKMSNQCMKAQNKQPLNIKGVRRAPSLEEACVFFQIPYPKDAHRALADAEVTAKVALAAYKHHLLLV